MLLRVILIMAVLVPPLSWGADESALEQAYRNERRSAQAWTKDFLRHQQIQAAIEREREVGARDHKARRQKDLEAMERARVNFVLVRERRSPEVSEDYWEREMAKQRAKDEAKYEQDRLLNKHDIDYKEITAGEFKRTVTLLGELTPKGLDKFKEQIEETHQLFKNFVVTHRPTLDLAKVATGEHWFGAQAIQLNLVDELKTSDDYLITAAETADVYKVTYHEKKRLSERLSLGLSHALHLALIKIWSEISSFRYGQ